VIAWRWDALWLYFLGPVGGMLAVGEVFHRMRGAAPECVGLNQAASETCVYECAREHYGGDSGREAAHLKDVSA
jgi:hypothetical protein